ADITTGDCDGGGTPMCSISATISVSGGCDTNNQVPVDLVVTASDQGANFTVTVDGISQGSFSYMGSTTNITINIDGDGQDHTINLTDATDPACSTSTTVNTPNCNLPCSITNLVVAEAGASGGTTHTVNVEDFIFNPSIINITTGDLVEWVWTGAIAHTSTSDATSGVDSWDSGLLNTGATYTSPALNEGEHPYYCIPHGSPGGVGMAGSIFVLPPCNAGNEVSVNVNFDIASNGTSGYEVLVDGAVTGTFSYVGGAAQNASINVIGDAMSHTIQVRDIDDNACNASADITTGDCDGGGTPMCSISATISVSGGCDTNNQVPVDLVVIASDQGANFTVTVDGISQGSFSYTGSTTNITINIEGDGQDHTINLTDATDPTCSTSTTLNTTNCSSECNIESIDISFGQSTTHIVQVEDFKFTPDSINIVLGDTILFDWTGVIPHTATSDNNTGSDNFNSGLRSQGETYQIIFTTIGDHPYYCIPHGAPGGIGMAGNVLVSTVCNGDEALANLSIASQGASGQGFKLVLDGQVLPESPLTYSPNGPTLGSIVVPGDSLMHVLVVSDVNDINCKDSIIFFSPDCNMDSCQTLINGISFGDCDGATVPMIVVFSSNSPNSEHNIYINNNLLSATPIITNDSGLGEFTAVVAGLGTEAAIVVSNVLIQNCTDTMLVVTPDCAVPCLMSELTVGSEANTHVIEVRDFDFFPKEIDVLLGDTLRFTWTGVIPHTTTSDANNGIDIWDSGLFGEGHVYDVVINTEGVHPYYCIPHGGPSGIGMSGSVTTIDTCDGDQWLTNYSFEVSAGSPLGYNFFIDGDQVNASPLSYDNPTGFNSGIISLPGDGETHLVTFQDLETDFCAITTSVITGECGAGCTISNLNANLGADVIHKVEVRDFDFLPLEITVRVGETIRFVWKGDIPHTSTSDAISGPDSWDSGLLFKGDTFDIIVNTPGDHPYYCIPHGGPGGIGQSGLIHALPQCEDGNQEVTISFDADGGSSQGYKLFIDGELIGGLNTYDDPQGNNSISILLVADGQEHIVTIQDDENPICAASAFYDSQDCLSDCEMSDITYEIISNHHTVLVRDFDFLPLELTVEAGDTILFDWIGDIPHTVTSDVIDGPSSFNSGLLQEGDQWILILMEIGEHPYYCIPHGGPGGIGMAGNITVVDPCEDEVVTTKFEFTSSKLSGNYNVIINGSILLSNQSYSGVPLNSFIINLPADNSTLNIEVVDVIDPACNSQKDIEGINCNDPCFALNADYEYDIDFATLEVLFSDISSGNIVTWNWDFGDGNSSIESNPAHTYADPSVYEVCLTVTDIEECLSTYCDKVRFGDEICTANFTFIQVDLDITFTNTSDFEDPNTTILWTFGDGAISNNTDDVAHSYNLGIYTACIQIESDSCVATHCKVIDLSDPCLTISPEFEVVKDGDNLNVQFNDLTTGQPDKWLWGFGDGSTSTDQNPNYDYQALGNYNVCLFVQELENSCSKTMCKTIIVGTTGVQEIRQYKTLELYPNPTSIQSGLFIRGFDNTDNSSKAKLEIIDMNGRKVNVMDITIQEEVSISTTVHPGVYYIRIISNKNVYQGMIVML
ncbi:MAG: plastocyanin/PKD repeat protein, partial [Saprospiraceae bacterium]